MKFVLLLVIALMTTGQAEAIQKQKVVAKKTVPQKPSMGKGLKKPNLRGSKAVAKKQNSQANKERLTRIEDAKQLKRFVESRILVPLPNSLAVRVAPALGEQYRYCRPWTRKFLEDLGVAHLLRFHRPIQVNSAVRTLERQKVLRRTNGNAAPLTGETASSHPTASTVDIAKSDSSVEKEWMRDYLQQQRDKGKIAVAEEFQQPVFHVMVFKNYGVKKKVVVPKSKPKKVLSHR
ncbi:hypothetical protein H0W91_03525 [Patescibacteria group bacterium]|nr:hypothetical protein [Patescibacteria group bacterium]